VRGWLRGARPIATARRPLLIEGPSYPQPDPVDDVRRRRQPAAQDAQRASATQVPLPQ
jgi:hypothetical protein